MAGLLDSLLNALMGQGVRKQLRRNAVARGNTPFVEEHMALKGGEDPRFGSDRTWIVDRVFEPQTFPHFVAAAIGGMPFPGGEENELVSFPDDFALILQPYSSWAPAPFSADQTAPMHKIMIATTSDKDRRRLQIISKELHAMKSRIWEVVMPLSARRWREKQLYDLANFSQACQVLSMVVNVVHYLNDAIAKPALRDTFNLIDDELRTFESAVNAKRALEGQPAVEVCKTWHQYVRAQYAVMCNHSHAWVMEHVGRLKSAILEQIEAHGTSTDGPTSTYDEEQWKLTNMWQDITELSAHADYAILLPMDGYNGAEPVPEHPEYDCRTQPLSFKPDIGQRAREYHQRRKHLSMDAMMQNVVGGLGKGPLPMNDAGDILQRCREQDEGQRRARAELRGEPARYEKEPWAATASDKGEWGFVAFRAHHTCSDAEWDEYRSKFEADIANWGEELAGVEAHRERSRIHWLDAKDMGIRDGGIKEMKSAFNSMEKSESPGPWVSEIFLIADEASVSSYLNPQPESCPPGDDGGFILAVEADFDAAQGRSRPDESPSYDGSLRVLGSLLWDDLGALVATQTQSLEDLWPLAMNHPSRVYVGPVSKAQTTAWAAQ